LQLPEGAFFYEFSLQNATRFEADFSFSPIFFMSPKAKTCTIEEIFVFLQKI